MPKDYLPASDPMYRDWCTAFFAYAVANAVALGWTALEVDAASDLYEEFASDLDAHIAAQNAAQAKREAKDISRAASVEAVRTLVRKAQANPNVTDVQRQNLGITVPDRSKTPVPPPTTSPLGVVEMTERYTHVLRIADSANPGRFAKPDGVIGAEVLCKIGGEAPAGDEGMTSLGIATKAKFTANFTNADGNKMAYYALRWVGTRGEKGPLGETIAATIAA